MSEWIERPVTHFRGLLLPEPAIPAGYAALVERFELSVPLSSQLAAIAARHHPQPHPLWRLLTPRHRPADTLEGQLVFALKWEGVDLGVLAALFARVPRGEVSAIVTGTPTGAFARRIWFLYEWLTGRLLDVPDPGKVRSVPLLDPELQVALEQGTLSQRHKVIDNLPGTRRFCPLIRWTPALRAAAAKELDARAREIVGRTRQDLVTRAAAFLLLSDSKSSFAIEGERPPRARAARWASAIGEAGARPLTLDELERLQRLVIGDARFVPLGLRTEGGFVGTHDRETQEPVPEHISARPEALPDLLAGVIDYERRALEGGVAPVTAAAAIAFGFVYIHPFVDGNGRIHRWLIHHVLAAAGYNPPGIVFPISAAILRRIDAYRAVLESYSAALLPLIEWRPTRDGNLEVLSDSTDYYRYFDATQHAEFLYACVEQTVEHDLPEEVRFLEAFDAFSSGVKELVEMPDRQIEQLRVFLAQGHGKLSERARHHEFQALTEAEALQLEELYARVFAPGP
ncbi:MAG TPA: Fic family protein [Polyangiaceae bacterium]|nr:Fic family protein [Polyangiaceae bacterium]